MREVDLHAELRETYTVLLAERAGWPGAGTEPALFLNRRGGRLGTRGASAIFAAILERASLDDGSAHVLRHHSARRPRAPAPISANTAPVCTPNPARSRSSPPNASMPRHLRPTPRNAAGSPKPNDTSASSPNSTP